MSYKLKFLPSALKEWKKLGSSTQAQFKKKLITRLENPEVPKDRLRFLENCYKIKLRSVGYRLVYEVDNNEITVIVISVGKRDSMRVYDSARRRKMK